jgi:repressor of nif and glnA expression
VSYTPPYRVTPKIVDLVSRISEAIGSLYIHEELRLHRINRVKTIQGSLAIEGNTLTPDAIKYHLQKLTAAGIITRHGSARSGEWESNQCGCYGNEK